MEFQMHQEVFAQALAATLKAVAKNSINPIITHLRLDARPGTVEFCGTDGDFVVVRNVAAEVKRPGVALIPASTLAELVNKLPKKEISVTLNEADAEVVVKSGRSEYGLRFATGFFPAVPTLEGTGDAQVPANELKRALQQVAYAACKTFSGGGAHYINGVLFAISSSRMDVCGTDGNRLALREVTVLTAPAVSELRLLVPAQVAEDLEALLPDDDTPVIFGYSHNRVVCKFGSLLIASSLFDVSFPDYRRFIPTTFEGELLVKRTELELAISRVSLVCNRATDKNPICKMQVVAKADDAQAGLLTLQALEGVGRGGEELEGVRRGEGLIIHFNPGMVSESLRKMPGDEVALKFNGPKQPLMLVSPREPGLCALIMPVRVD